MKKCIVISVLCLLLFYVLKYVNVKAVSDKWSLDGGLYLRFGNDVFFNFLDEFSSRVAGLNSEGKANFNF